MIPDPESDFQLFSDSGFGSSKKQNLITNRDSLIPALDPGSESDCQNFDNSKYIFGSSKRCNHYTSTTNRRFALGHLPLTDDLCLKSACVHSI